MANLYPSSQNSKHTWGQPAFAITGDKFFATENSDIDSPWAVLERRGDIVFATSHHPSKVFGAPLFKVHGNVLYPTANNSDYATGQAAFVIRD